MSTSRAAQLAANLAAVEFRLAEACRTAGRARADVTVIAVTKGHPADDVALLADLGVADMGESRDQEARAKVARCADLVRRMPLRWHFIGQLQRNKIRSVAGYAWMVHTVDRPQLVDDLRARMTDAAPPRGGFLLQVNLDPALPAGRGGVAPSVLPALADRLAEGGMAPAGVMAVAPPGEDPRRAFDRLAALSGRLRAAHPSATAMSAGMSGDLEAAVSAGATHLRIGSAILGNRPELR